MAQPRMTQDALLTMARQQGGLTEPGPPALDISIGRAAGYALGRFPWHRGILTRATLTALIGPDVRNRVRDPGGRLRKWLRITQARGHIRLGQRLIQLTPTSADHLLHEATRDLDGYATEGDFVDLQQGKTLLPFIIDTYADDAGYAALLVHELAVISAAVNS